MIIAEGELVNVAQQVLPTYNVVYANVSALESAPEAVNRVGMGFPVGMLARAVVDSVLGLRHAVIGRKAVGVDRDGAKRVFINHRRKLGVIHAVHYLCSNLALSLNDAYYRGLGLGRSALRSFGLVGRMLVNLAPAKVGLVHFNLARKRVLALGVDFADTMIKEPNRLLRNAYHLRKLDARDAFLRSGEKIDSEEPLIEWELGFSEDRAGTKRELLAASGAFVGLAVREGVSVFVAAMRAVDALAKAGFEKIVIASVFVREPRVELVYRLHAYNISL